MAQIAAPALELIDLTLAYGNRTVLSGVNAVISEASQVAVIGPNGAGKSTLFKALVGLLKPAAGRLLLHGRPLDRGLKRVAYVPQREEIDWQFPVTVLDVVLMGRYGHIGWLRRPGRQDRAIALEWLERLGMVPMADRPIAELSGGQQQRVFLARALAQQPELLVLDEPFAGVDSPTQETVLELLAALRSQGITVLLSTHDLPLASSRFDQLMLLNRRLVAFGRPSDVIDSAILADTFGSQILFYHEKDGVLALADCCCPPCEARRRPVSVGESR